MPHDRDSMLIPSLWRARQATIADEAHFPDGGERLEFRGIKNATSTAPISSSKRLTHSRLILSGLMSDARAVGRNTGHPAARLACLWRGVYTTHRTAWDSPYNDDSWQRNDARNYNRVEVTRIEAHTGQYVTEY